MKIKGVGGKVADCILLFSMGRFEVFPNYTYIYWIKRVLSEVYGVGEKDIDGFVGIPSACAAATRSSICTIITARIRNMRRRRIRANIMGNIDQN